MSPMRNRRALVVSMLVLGSACKPITDAYKAPGSPGLGTVNVPTSAIADGATLVRLEAMVDGSLTGDARAVKFTTTAGLFRDRAETTVRADAEGKAVALLRAPTDTVTAIIVATAGVTAIRKELQFTPAFAQWIDVDPAALVIEAAAGREIEVTAVLRRSFGVPNPGADVRFTADTSGHAAGVFTSIPRTNSSGIAKTRYSIGATSFRGLVRIIATTTVENAREIRDTTLVQVVAPR
jgi:hypothetical protein